MLKAKRKKKCKVCGNPFRPSNSLQLVCFTLKCAIEQGNRSAEKQRKREYRAAKQKLKPRGKLQAEAQAAFNAFIRLRDARFGCISCGETNPPARFGGAWDCGHYLTVGAHPELRFEELNAHRQCKRCNGGAGRFSQKSRTVQRNYRNSLMVRIGLDKVEWLEGPHKAKKYTLDHLRAIKSLYQAKRLELKRCRSQML